jgi:hypothetical protein
VKRWAHRLPPTLHSSVGDVGAQVGRADQDRAVVAGNVTIRRRAPRDGFVRSDPQCQRQLILYEVKHSRVQEALQSHPVTELPQSAAVRLLVTGVHPALLSHEITGS